MESTLVSLLIILLVAWVAGAVASRLGYPSILGELAIGILLGPAVLGWLHADEGLKILAELGVFLMMLYIGMEIDHRDLFGASWAGLLTAVGGFIFPALLGYGAAIAFHEVTQKEALFLALALGVTALAVNSRILVDMKLLGTRVGNVLVAGALITDTIAIVLFAAVIAVMDRGGLQWGVLAAITGKAVVFFGVTTFLGVFVFPFVGQRMLKAGLTERTANFTLVLLVALTFALMAHWAGLHAILGAFLAGLFLREEVMARKLSNELATIVHDLSIGFLAPLFFVIVGFDVSLGVFRTHLPMLLTIIAVATVGKVLGTMLFYLPTRNGWREGLVLGMGMNGRGAVEIIFAEIGLRKGFIGPDTFSMLVIMAFVTTATVPMLLRWGTQWLRKHGELVRTDQRRSGTVIVGAGPLARAVARELAGFEPVRLIDTRREDVSVAQSEGLGAMLGNALREETLSVAQVGHARQFIALTSNDEVNRFSAQAAREAFGVPEVYVPRQPVPPGGSPFLGTLHTGETPLFGGQVPVADWSRWIARQEVERVTLTLNRATTPAQFFAELNGNDGMLPLLAVRDGMPALFHTVSELRVGDEVVALRRRGQVDPLEERMRELLRGCPILDVPGEVTLEQFLRDAAAALSPRVGISAESMAESLLNRERESSTVILPHVAIPHLLVEGSGVFDMLLARSRGGVQFRPGGSAVRAIFLLLSSRDERNTHLRALSTIGRFFQEPGFEEKWLAAPDPDAVRDLLLALHRRSL